MAILIQDWLMDPTALLFIASLITILVLLGRRRKSRANRSPASQTEGGRSRRTGWRGLLVILWVGFFLIASAPAVVNPLLTTLENRYPVEGVCESGSHLVTLGGGVDSRVQAANEFERMSSSTMARATAAARIAEREPDVRLIAAGGALRTITEADVIATYWQALGIDEGRILREGRSSNTYENAINVAQMLAEENVEGPVRLLSSALHMPRAMQTFTTAFAEQGLEVCPVSVNRESLSDVPLFALMPQTTALVKFDKWLHEMAALAIYRMRGWI